MSRISIFFIVVAVVFLFAVYSSQMLNIDKLSHKNDLSFNNVTFYLSENFGQSFNNTTINSFSSILDNHSLFNNSMSGNMSLDIALMYSYFMNSSIILSSNSSYMKLFSSSVLSNSSYSNFRYLDLFDTRYFYLGKDLYFFGSSTHGAYKDGGVDLLNSSYIRGRGSDFDFWSIGEREDSRLRFAGDTLFFYDSIGELNSSRRKINFDNGSITFQTGRSLLVQNKSYVQYFDFMNASRSMKFYVQDGGSFLYNMKTQRVFATGSVRSVGIGSEFSGSPDFVGNYSFIGESEFTGSQLDFLYGGRTVNLTNSRVLMNVDAGVVRLYGGDKRINTHNYSIDNKGSDVFLWNSTGRFYITRGLSSIRSNEFDLITRSRNVTYFSKNSSFTINNDIEAGDNSTLKFLNATSGPKNGASNKSSIIVIKNESLNNNNNSSFALSTQTIYDNESGISNGSTQDNVNQDSVNMSDMVSLNDNVTNISNNSNSSNSDAIFSGILNNSSLAENNSTENNITQNSTDDNNSTAEMVSDFFDSLVDNLTSDDEEDVNDTVASNTSVIARSDSSNNGSTSNKIKLSNATNGATVRTNGGVDYDSDSQMLHIYGGKSIVNLPSRGVVISTVNTSDIYYDVDNGQVYSKNRTIFKAEGGRSMSSNSLRYNVNSGEVEFSGDVFFVGTNESDVNF